MLLGIPRVGVAQLTNMADGREIRGRELIRRTTSGRRVEMPGRSGSYSAGVDRRPSDEEVPHRAKFVERVGFDDIHPQICRETIGNLGEQLGGISEETVYILAKAQA